MVTGLNNGHASLREAVIAKRVVRAREKKVAHATEPLRDGDAAATQAQLSFNFDAAGNRAIVAVRAYWGERLLAFTDCKISNDGARRKLIAALKTRESKLHIPTAEHMLEEQSAAATVRVKRGLDTAASDPIELLNDTPPEVRAIAMDLLQSRELMARMLADVAQLGVAGEGTLVESIFVVGVSRLLRHPLSMIAQAPSSSGKSFTVNTVAKLFPPEAVIFATSLTPQALYYADPGTFAHRLIIGGERSHRTDDESADATKALREMISTGELSKLVTATGSGGMRSRIIKQEGPIAYVETTTQSAINNEDANRCLIVTTDERPEQTRAVIKKQAHRYSNPEPVPEAQIIAVHHAVQRLLRPLEVVIPFAPDVERGFDTMRVEARRGFDHLMRAVQASALLYQFRRKRDENDRIIATRYDYARAVKICQGPLARLLGGRVVNAALRFFERLQGFKTEFTTTDAARFDHKHSQTIREWLAALAEAGAVVQLEPGAGSRPAVWRREQIDLHELTGGAFRLPTTSEVFEPSL